MRMPANCWRRIALDAVVGDEYEQIEAHLDECPRCRAELDAYRDVTAAMGNSVEPLPEGLWTSISSRLPERRMKSRRPCLGWSSPTVRKRAPSKAGSRPACVPRATVLAVDRHDRRRCRRRGHRARASTWCGRTIGWRRTRTPSASRRPPPWWRPWMTPGHKLVNLDNTSGHRLAQFVITPDWRGYLVPPPEAAASAETYQLWAINDGRSISLGLLGSRPTSPPSLSAGSPGPSQLGITVEPAGGSVVPSSPMVASGTV